MFNAMIIDYLNKTINIKVVYCGPAFSGKTTSIKSLFSIFGKKNQVNSIENTIGRTLFFDYGTVAFKGKEYLLKFHIYTTTGQDFYMVTRPITLKAVDGIIFVADLDEDVYERNLISWNELNSYFKKILEDIPIVLAFNKNDLLDKWFAIEFLNAIKYHKFNTISTHYTIATQDKGIQECFEDIKRLILKKNFSLHQISLKN